MIKLVVFDFDGVFTDGKVIFDHNGNVVKSYNSKDGLGITLLKDKNIKIGVISGYKETSSCRSILEHLGIQHIAFDCKNKLEMLQSWCDELGVGIDEEVAYMGDDVNDLSVLQAVQWSACPSDAVDECKDIVDVVTEKGGGQGCVREFCQRIVKDLNVNYTLENIAPVRHHIKVIDCTLRDGGIVNEWNFTDEFVTKLIETANESNIPIIEIGYINDSHKNMPFWSNVNITTFIEKFKTGNVMPAVMGDVNTFDPSKLPDVDGNILFRMASNAVDIDKALIDLEILKKKGYRTSINLMKSPYVKNWLDIISKIKLKAKHIDMFYIADSFGSMYPYQVSSLTRYIRKHLPDTIKIGFHGHNQLQLANANSIAAIEAGATMIDSTMMGMGKGPGNLTTELITMFLNKSNYKFNLRSIVEFIDIYMKPLSQEFEWGYQVKYMICGSLNATPRFGQYMRNHTSKMLLDLIENTSLENRLVVNSKTSNVAIMIPIKLVNMRCPGKNVRMLNGKPLCSYIFNTVQKVIPNIPNCKAYVYCSDAEICKYIPDGINFVQRDPKYDSNETKFNDLFLSFTNIIDSDVYCLCHTTAPFISNSTIERCISKVVKNGFDSSFTVIPQNDYMWINKTPMYDLHRVPRTQDIVSQYIETSGCYVFTKNVICQMRRRIGVDPAHIIVSKLEAVDIDTEDDFKHAETLLQ